MLKLFLKHFVFVFYFLLNFLCGSPILFGARIAADRLSQSHDLRLLGLILNVILALTGLGLLVLSGYMTSYFLDYNFPFFTSFKLVWVNLWESLPSTPIIRHWFHSDETITRPPEQDDSDPE